MEITEKWLMEAGGWQRMKPARHLVKAGKVLEVEQKGELVQGQVLQGERAISCGMIIKSRIDVENLCNCLPSRRDGMLCEHTLALGVAIARGETGSGAAPKSNDSSSAATTKQQPSPPQIKVPKGSLEIFFPPTFAPHWTKGQVMLTTRWIDGENDPADLPFLGWIQQHGLTEIPPMLMLKPEQAGELLLRLSAHPRLVFGKERTPLKIGDMPARLTLKAKEHREKVVLQVDPPAGDIKLLPAPGQSWVFDAERHLILPLAKVPPSFDEEMSALLKTISSGRGEVRTLAWFLSHADLLHDAFQIEGDSFIDQLAVIPGRPSFHLEIEGSVNHLAAKLRILYPGKTNTNLDSGFPFPDPAEPNRFIERNPLAEQAAIALLGDAGFGPPDRDGFQQLSGQNEVMHFFGTVMPQLEASDHWTLRIGKRFQHMTKNVERVSPQIEFTSSGEDWLHFEVNYGTPAGNSVPKSEIQRLLRTGQPHARLKNGTVVVVNFNACEDVDEVLQDCNPSQDFGAYKVKKHQKAYLEETASTWVDAPEAEPEAHPVPWDKIEDLDTILRSYQKDGVAWIYRLSKAGLGGILADEMGLGKTLQSLSAIDLNQKTGDPEAGPSLIVCPTSLLGNWRDEAAKFVPHLKVGILHGPQRKKIWEELHSYDIVITSYALLVRDGESHREQVYRTVVLDEAAAIKNPKTENAKAARALQAENRFALTGTPIENSVRDLWSIMEFLLPGYLGTKEDFKARYEQPISTGIPDPQAQSRLRRRLAPYLLRRTKKAVAKELPDKIEKIIYCDLTEKQREVYEGVLRESQNKIHDATRSGNSGQARMTMLTALLRLRQVCCDLRLVNVESEIPEASTKGLALDELLTKIEEGGHRVLIFSQFVSMLGLLKEKLEERNLKYCYLDGSTKKRTEEVSKFQGNPQIPCFLISLKAGGYGLNLTGADTVIHFDPWWNPAVEAQATDRAHRIGQENVVTSMKLITRGTVEEKIVKLQRKKRNVIDAALDEESPMMTGLSMNDLEELFE